jgi:hypothetical protein
MTYKFTKLIKNRVKCSRYPVIFLSNIYIYIYILRFLSSVSLHVIITGRSPALQQGWAEMNVRAHAVRTSQVLILCPRKRSPPSGACIGPRDDANQSSPQRRRRTKSWPPSLAAQAPTVRRPARPTVTAKAQQQASKTSPHRPGPNRATAVSCKDGSVPLLPTALLSLPLPPTLSAPLPARPPSARRVASGCLSGAGAKP